MREELEKLIAEATPGPWEVDTIYNEDGCYSGGGGCGQGFNDYAIYAPIDGKAVQILDTSYSDDKLIEEDFGEDGKIAWDCIGKANADLIVFLVNNAPAILEALTERASMAAEIERLREFIANPPKHNFWGAGEPDCPRELKAGNGELHTLRCKVCGLDSPKDDVCRAQMEVDHAE
jgi:hypothetical protein